MAKIFTKLNIGDTVATSGTRVFKKLTTEEPEPSLPIWNGKDLTGTEWYLPAGWTAEAGYGSFDVQTGIYEKLHIGYKPYMFGDPVPTADFVCKTVVGAQSNQDNSCDMTIEFAGGTDATNPRLINWLLENGTLTSHQMPTDSQ